MSGQEREVNQVVYIQPWAEEERLALEARREEERQKFDALVQESKAGYRLLDHAFLHIAREVVVNIAVLERYEVVSEVLEMQRTQKGLFARREDERYGRLQDIFIDKKNNLQEVTNDEEKIERESIDFLREKFALRIARAGFAKQLGYPWGKTYRGVEADKEVKKACKLVVEAMRKFGL